MKLLKNILLIFLIFSLVVPCAQAKKPAYYGYYGQVYIPGYGPTNRARIVASGSISAYALLGDFTATNAFIGGIDVSAYQDGNHYIEIQNDATGYKASGFISAVAPGGETLGGELVDAWTNHTNPSYAYETLTAGVGNLIAQAVNTTGIGICYKATTATIGALYKLTTAKTQTSGTAPSLYWAVGTGMGAPRITLTQDATYYFTTLLAHAYVGYIIGDGVATDFAITTFTLKRMTDCAVTGGLILSTRGGATRAWSNQHASFNANAASTYKIYRLPESRSLVAEGSISLYTNKLDSTTANAFFDSLDVSAYRDGNYYIELTDSVSKKAGAYLATTVPGGATFGADLVTDGGFAAVTETTNYTSDFSAGVDSFTAAGGAVAGNIDGIGGQDNNLRLTCDTANSGHTLLHNNTVGALPGTKYIEAKYYVPSGQSNVDGSRLLCSATEFYTDISNVQDAWTQLSGYVCQPSIRTLVVRAYDGTAYVFTDAGGDDLLYIREVIGKSITFTSWTASSNVISPAVAAYALANKVNFATATATLTQAGILTDKALYKIIHTLSSRTAGSLIVKAGTGEGASRSADGTYTEYITSIGTDLVLSATGLVGQSDAVSAERMTDCSITGAYLLSARGGARGFAVYESGYRPDLAQTYKIYKLN